MPGSLSAVLFDLDDTLLDSLDARIKTLQSVFTRANITHPTAEQLLLSLKGTPIKDALAKLEVSLKIEDNLDTLDESDRKVQQGIEEFYRQIPLEIRGQLDRLKHVAYAQPAEPGPITEEEEKKIMEDVDKFFKKRGEGG